MLFGKPKLSPDGKVNIFLGIVNMLGLLVTIFTSKKS